VSTDEHDVQRQRAVMIGHGALMIFAGLLAGFAFLFDLIDAAADESEADFFVRAHSCPDRCRQAERGSAGGSGLQKSST
jgi:hypothetical protein